MSFWTNPPERVCSKTVAIGERWRKEGGRGGRTVLTVLGVVGEDVEREGVLVRSDVLGDLLLRVKREDGEDGSAAARQ